MFVTHRKSNDTVVSGQPQFDNPAFGEDSDLSAEDDVGLLHTSLSPSPINGYSNGTDEPSLQFDLPEEDDDLGPSYGADTTPFDDAYGKNDDAYGQDDDYLGGSDV